MGVVVTCAVGFTCLAVGFIAGAVAQDRLDRGSPAAISCLCPHCTRLLRWTGGYLRMPPCPRCGWRPDLAELHQLSEEFQL